MIKIPRKAGWFTREMEVKISKVKRKIKGKEYIQRIIYVPQHFADVEKALLKTIE